jgi:FMN phosphatase YigB (HAD superfamily)
MYSSRTLAAVNATLFPTPSEENLVTLTLLFDLDGTLLDNQEGEFVPAYLRALSGHLSNLVEPGRLMDALLTATRKMSLNLLPECTLQQVFDNAFYPTIGIDKETLRQPIDQFYAEVFPTLQRLTRPKPEAVTVIEEALRRGYRLAVATAPLFPLTAIEQRLAWAGLPVERYPFALVPSYESFHFAKPYPEYLAEILARLGWPEDPVVMVGDDLDNDIKMAQRLGLAAYWAKAENTPNHLEGCTALGSGYLASLLPWIDSLPPQSLQPDYETRASILATMRSTAAVIDQLCNRVAETFWNQRPVAGEWSLTEIICHLRDVDSEVNLPRLQKVVQESNPFVPGKDTDQWAEERKYINQNGSLALAHFKATRQKLIALLSGLEPDDWQRPARHAIFGPTRLQELANIIAGHDRLHIHQILQTVTALT